MLQLAYSVPPEDKFGQQEKGEFLTLSMSLYFRINIDILPSNIDVHVLNIHILVSNIHILISQKKYGTLAYNDIFPNIMTIEILSSHWKRGKHKNTFLVSKTRL